METIIPTLALLIGSIFGFFLGKILTKNSTNNVSKEEYKELQKQRDSLLPFQGKVESLNKQINDLKDSHLLNIQDLKNDWDKRETSLKVDKEKYEAKYHEIKDSISKVEKREAELNKEKEQLEKSSQKLNEQISKMQQNFKEQIEDSQKLLQTKFQNISNEIFEAKSKSLKEESKQSIESLLNPLKDNINEFKKAVNDKYNVESKERHSIKEELGRLRDLNTALSTDAQNLTSALQGNVKAQGNWGEMQIEKILEFSGLVENRDYVTQGRGMKMEYDIGQRQQPDVIINLPENKHLIIDAKVTLNSYTRYINAETKEDKAAHLKEFTTAVKNHIDGLTKRDYEYSDKVYTPEYVLMFMPIEGALSLALENNTEIFEYGWNKGVILVGPTNLLATLKAVSSVWKQEKQKQSIQKIVKLGGSIYDKLHGFISDMEKIKSSLDAAQKSYDKAYSKLTVERGNVIGAAQKMKSLGVTSKKSFSEDLVENSLINEVNPELPDGDFDEAI